MGHPTWEQGACGQAPSPPRPAPSLSCLVAEVGRIKYCCVAGSLCGAGIGLAHVGSQRVAAGPGVPGPGLGPDSRYWVWEDSLEVGPRGGEGAGHTALPRRAAPVQSGGLRGGVGASLPPTVRCRGTRSCSLVLGLDPAGLHTGRVESTRVLLGCGHSLGGRTCAHAAGRGRPSPASLPALQAAPNLRKPQKASGRVGAWRGCSRGRNKTQQSKAKVCPQPPARTPTPPYLVPGPACRNCSLGAGLRNAIER